MGNNQTTCNIKLLKETPKLDRAAASLIKHEKTSNL